MAIPLSATPSKIKMTWQLNEAVPCNAFTSRTYRILPRTMVPRLSSLTTGSNWSEYHLTWITLALFAFLSAHKSEVGSPCRRGDVEFMVTKGLVSDTHVMEKEKINEELSG